MCQSRTDRKTDTLTPSRSRRTFVTRPSAGDRTSPAPSGESLAGSRKKKRTNAKRTMIGAVPQGPNTNPRTIPATRRTVRKGTACTATGTRAPRRKRGAAPGAPTYSIRWSRVLPARRLLDPGAAGAFHVLPEDGLHAILEVQLLFLDIDAFDPLGLVEGGLPLKFLKSGLAAGVLRQQLSILVVVPRKRPPQVLLDVHHRPQPPDLSGRSGEGDRDPHAFILRFSVPSSGEPRKAIGGLPGHGHSPLREGPSQSSGRGSIRRHITMASSCVSL